MSQAGRKVLSLAVCGCCHEAGFTSADESAIELLTVMMQSLINEIGRECQMLAEHNGRCEVTPTDLVDTLIDLGLNVESILDYAKKKNLIFRIPTPGREQPQKQPTILHTGQSRPKHSYIPDYFPSFPDAHSYIRTPTQRQPISEYEAIRDKAASQKRDLERALTRFMAKTCESDPEHSLFAQNASLNKYFPLISIKPSPLPFLDALLPKDQIFDDDDDEETASGATGTAKKVQINPTTTTNSTQGTKGGH